MRGYFGALIAAVLAAAPLAHAANLPRYLPGRDVMVVYRSVDPHANIPPHITARYFAVADRLRLDAGQGPYLLVDRIVERVQLVIPAVKLVLDLGPGGGVFQGFVLGDHLQARPSKAAPASRTILGRRCAVYDVTLEGAMGTACISADGLVLAGEGRLPDGRAGRIEAEQISFTPQPAGLFAPSDSYQMIGGAP